VAPRPRPEYKWDRIAGRYRDSRGRFVPPAQVREWLDIALENATKRIELLAAQLRAGRLDLISWEVAMRREVKNVALYSAAAAKGGWAQMSDADYGRVGQYVQQQYKYLRGFAQDIATGKQARDGRLSARASLYGEAGRPLFHRIEEAEQIVRGMTEKRNIRYRGDSCAGCQDATARGWVKIGDKTMPEIGARNCRTRCRCRFEYR
jgi:hypothetical protein